MNETDLSSREALKQACENVLEEESETLEYQDWLTRLTRLITEVRAADETERASLGFQKKLWDDNTVAAVGMGTVKVDEALANPEFRRWIAIESLKPVVTGEEKSQIRVLYRGLVEHFQQLGQRVPRLKIFRVLAALFPGHLTTVAATGMLKDLHAALGLPPTKDSLDRQFQIMSKINEAMGPCAEDAEAVARRMTVPWRIYEKFVATDVDPGDQPGEANLVPMPAMRRRRGMTAMTGYLTTAIGILDFVEEGVPREQVIDFIRSQSPHLKDSSIGVQINMLIGELGVLENKEGLLRPTPRGERLLETGDPDEVMDWLLTRVLGVDHTLRVLDQNGPMSPGELFPEIRKANPNWTTNFAPSAMLHWLLHLNVLEKNNQGKWCLTKRGRKWRANVTWEPELLEIPADVEVDETEPDEPGNIDLPSDKVRLPSLDQIFRRVREKGNFTKSKVAELHSALWHHQRRHFAILTGLSGSGKTLLARAYARALISQDDEAGSRMCTVPVQPGWYDPSSLLGYVNPLSADSYVRTPFLEFLLRAASDPLRPYTVVLDEMNLSHPEQYLAPILSAMETGAALALHRESDLLDGIPANVPYPSSLAIIGTVNMDETTHGLSDKVLDRAHTIEFWDVSVEDYPKWGETGLSGEQEDAIRGLLTDLMAALSPVRLHFGWRVIDDLIGYVRHRCAGNSGELREAMSEGVYAKILPKLRGEDSARLVQAFEETKAVLNNHGLGACAAKVGELLEDLRLQGTARFWR